MVLREHLVYWNGSVLFDRVALDAPEGAEFGGKVDQHNLPQRRRNRAMDVKGVASSHRDRSGCNGFGHRGLVARQFETCELEVSSLTRSEFAVQGSEFQETEGTESSSRRRRSCIHGYHLSLVMCRDFGPRTTQTSC